MTHGAKVDMKEVSYDEASGTSKVSMGLEAGRVWSKIIELATPESSWEVETANAVATVRGTAFDMEVVDGKSKIFTASHMVAVAVRDPGTRKMISKDDVLVEEGKILEIGAEEVAMVRENKPIVERLKLATAEFRKDAWIEDNGEVDQRVDERVRLDLLKWRCQRVQAAAQLVELPRLRPARQLAADVGRICFPRQEETGLEDRLVPDNLDQALEFHAHRIPNMASCCNRIGQAARGKGVRRVPRFPVSPSCLDSRCSAFRHHSAFRNPHSAFGGTLFATGNHKLTKATPSPILGKSEDVLGPSHDLRIARQMVGECACDEQVLR